MHIGRMLKQRPTTLSLEIFPPKPGGDLAAMYGVVTSMAALAPDFISVTYGAGGGTAKTTGEIAAFAQAQGVTALAHLTCVGAARADVQGALAALASQGIENVLALRGDIPQDTAFPAEGQYRYASELVADIRAMGGFCIGAACYPEGHVEAKSQAEDIAHVRAKVLSGCDFLTTQMFFDNSILYRFLYKLLRQGVDVPVLAGIMPVTNRRQIERILRMSGTVLPPRFLSILDRFGDDPRSMREAGVAYATEQIIDLIANGVEHIHLYTMNKPDIAADILKNLSAILGR